MFEIGSLINSFGSVTWVILFFVIALSIIVFVHEFGHYIVGRWCGIHADVFSIGFGPVLASGVDKRGTKWQFSVLPLGGYVKFRGDANAASGPDSEGLAELSDDLKRTTMHGAPLWARASTAAAGPVFNFILTAILFTGLFMSQGQTRDSLKIAELSDLPFEHDLKVGDEIIGVAGTSVNGFAEFGDAIAKLPTSQIVEYQILRDGSAVSLSGPYPLPTSVLGVMPQSAAISAGIKIGDVITAVNGEPVFGSSDVQKIVKDADQNALSFSIWRSGETFDLSIAPKVVDIPQPEGGFVRRSLVGVEFGYFFEAGSDPLPFGTAISAAVVRTFDIIRSSLSGMYHMITGAISTCNLSGPISIAETSGQMAAQGTLNFLVLIAVLSTGIGLVNLFPIPMLDGGHLMFHAYEAISGRPPSEKSVQFLMTLGMTLVFGLMLFALLNDLFCP